MGRWKGGVTVYIVGGFGILLIIIRLVIILKEDIEEKVKNNKLKNMSLKSGDYKYLDTHGRWRLINNGHRLDIGLTDEGYCVTDLSIKGHPVLRNLSLEECQNRFQEYREEYYKEKSKKEEWDKHLDKRPYYIRYTTTVYNALNNHSKEQVKGVRFKDFETGRLYIIIEYGDFWWYMDIQTLKLVRLTEAYNYVREKYNRELKIYNSMKGVKETGFTNKDEVDEYLRKNRIKSWLDDYVNNINYCSEETEEKLKKSFVYNNNMPVYSKTFLNNQIFLDLGGWNLYGKGGQ